MAETYPEPASISARSSLGGANENMAKMARGPGTAETLVQKLAPLVERVQRLNHALSNLGDRAYGEQPPRAERDDVEVRETPPYGGMMAELYYTIDRMDDAVRAAEASARRIDGLA